jgi:acetylornithine aminotransferase
MLGVEFDFDVSALRKKMIIEKHILQVDLVIKIYCEFRLNNYNYNDTFIVALQESLAE